MSEDKRTITVTGHFGDKTINKESFIKTWADHARELHRISNDPKWWEEVEVIRSKVEVWAGKEFEKIYKLAQNPDTHLRYDGGS